MSTPSTRRLKDRNGSGAKTAAFQKPTKTLTPISNLDPNPSSALKKSISGKENPRLNSRSQKPMLRPVPRVDKAATGVVSGSDGSEGRMRWSTSSVPRGRSSSPSEFIRVFRDYRASKGGSDSRIVSSAGKKNGGREFRDCKENSGFGLEFGKNSGFCEREVIKAEENEKNSSGSRTLNSNCNEGIGSGSSLIKSSEDDGVGESNSGSNLPKDVKVDKLCTDKSGSEFKFDCLKGTSEKSGSKAKALEHLKRKGLIEEVTGSKIGVKYPSKLHEKLAFLEGKVKRIASDIKRTKEMLDVNNPDASKVIISDIQDKISGIEKAIGNVGGDSSKIAQNEDGENEVLGKSKNEKMDQVNGSVKGLNNNEELEARLFPHHKLLRNRTVSKASSGSSQGYNESNVLDLSSESKVKEKLLSPIEENPIAIEFLASLNKKAKLILRDTKGGFKSCEFKETGNTEVLGKQYSLNMFPEKSQEELVLTTDETLDEFDDQENRHAIVIGEETEDACVYQVNEIGPKSSTGGWFVSEGESVLLAHDDGSCSFYDIANCEEKTVYKPSVGISPNIWRDCWIIRAAGADGCSGRFVVAASAGNTLDSGFCSWDFYTKDVQAFHMEDGATTNSRTVLGPLPTNTTYGRNALSGALLPETRQWWYKPCGPLIMSTASSQRVVKIFDIRDGEQIMKWEVLKPVLAMDNSSPLQWRNRGKVVIAETETISVWDVNSLNQQSLLSISLSGQKISALHVVNADAELGGGVRQRVTSAEAERNDGVFCTPDSINVLDFRHPSGIGLKIPKIGVSAQSVFTRGDLVYMGCTNTRSAGKQEPSSQVQQFSLRKQRIVSTYSMPKSNAHSHNSALTQVWGNSDFVMGICGLGLFVFDALNDDTMQSFTVDYGSNQNVKDVIGPDDLYSPSFDYLSSRVLLISRDRPAMWRQLS